MNCLNDGFTTNNKKSFSNHMRWCNGLLKHGVKGLNLGEKHFNWKGDKVGRGSLHDYIKYHLSKPEICGACKKKKRLDLANISQKYLRVLTDWEWLCRRCHMEKDGRLGNLKLLKKYHANKSNM